MTGMEMMLSKLIGMTPDQMKVMATTFVQSVEDIQNKINEMNNRLIAIEQKLYPESAKEKDAA